MLYSTNDLKIILNAQLIGDWESSISQVSIDSRSVKTGEDTLFVAIHGQRFNGHDFIVDLYKNKGIRTFLVSTNGDFIGQCSKASFLLVPNTLDSLQVLATHHRTIFKYPVIGITGSNGKTIVKEWLAALLAPDYRVVRSPKSYNSQVGVPLSALALDTNFDLAILEAGISLPGEMERLEPIISPTIGVFTNLGTAHSENFIDLISKAEEKMKLFIRSKVLIYCKDIAEVDELAEVLAREKGVELFAWSMNKPCRVGVSSVTPMGNCTSIEVLFDGRRFDFVIPFTDDASIQNAITCLCVLLYLGSPIESIVQRMETLVPVAMRLELKGGINGCTIINDSYNSDLGSLAIALDFLAQQKQHAHRLVVISDILQSGYPPDTLYKEVSKLLSDKGVDRMVGIGGSISRYSGLFDIPSIFYPDTSSFLSGFNRSSITDTAILLKGSRVFEFERISAAFEQKTHRTVLEVDLNALVHNLNYFRSLLKPGVMVMVMVKAFSYGSGSHEIASTLQYHNVDYLGVAFADEGVALRQAGITLPIIVLNPAYGSYNLMIRHSLEPEIFSQSSLDSFLSAASKAGASNYPIHIKVDTGMHRLGFSPDEVEPLCQKLMGSPCLRVQSILSHLVGSDSREHDDFTQTQISVFKATANAIITRLGYKPTLHILNSGGIERFPEAQLHMVRLGIGLYGVSAVHQSHLQPVSTLKTFIAQLRTVNAGETVGYNRKGVVSGTSTIATIPIGYADGLNRRLSNGVGRVMVNGKLAPIIGNICMDLSMIDVTGIDVSEGDEVVVFGAKPTILEIADAMGTIPYEVLTSISRRVNRVYYQE